MNLQLYQYGHCSELSGISIGVARRAPRGIRKEDRFRKGYFQAWMPLLAPSRELYSAYRKRELTYSAFATRYRREMKNPESQQAIWILAAMSNTIKVNLGCFCKDESKCHRSILADLIRKAAAERPLSLKPTPQYSSPACSMPEIED